MQSVSDTWSVEAVDTVRKIAANYLVSWKKENLLTNRTFTIGVSTIGGPDIIGANPGAVGSPGQWRYFDESAYLTELAWERYLNQPVGGLTRAVAETRLDNTSRRFLPGYMGGDSELHTAVLPRRPFIINSGFHFEGIDQLLPQFAGVFTRSPEIDRRRGRVILEGADYADFFYNRYLDNELMFTSQYTDVVLEDMLQSMGMATSQYELDAGLNRIRFGLFPRGAQFSDLIHEIVRAENGQAYFDEEGIFRFENRHHWTNFPHFDVQRVIATSQVLEAQAPSGDHIINVVEVVGEPRSIEDEQMAWDIDEEGGGVYTELPVGERVEYWVNFNDPMYVIDTPTKLDTDTSVREQDTGLASPSATGEDYSDWIDPENALADGSGWATSGAVANARQDYYNFGLGVPNGSTILGIEVVADAADGVSGATLAYELSWDGGATYTTSGKSSGVVGGSFQNYTQGGSSDTWGRSWTAEEFNNANFRLRVRDASGTNNIALDHIQVRVYYSDPTEEQTSYYAANSLKDKTGTDLTDNITLVAIDKFTQAAKLTLRNDGSQVAFLTALIVWGRPVRQTEQVYYREAIGNSVTAYEERPYKIESQYIQDIAWAESLAKMILADYAYPENLQTITIRAMPELQLGDLISWQGRYWRIFGIRATLNPSVGFVQELDLLQRTIETYFRIGISTIGGSDKIAP